jgi:hypothetical protein
MGELGRLTEKSDNLLAAKFDRANDNFMSMGKMLIQAMQGG